MSRKIIEQRKKFSLPFTTKNSNLGQNLMSESSGKNPSNPKIDDLDLPIASRKGVHSCTKHHMSNYVSYDKLSPTFLAFTSQLSSAEIPKNV